MSYLILIRHGQSTWNAEDKFTGWVDVDLSYKGVKEAENSGEDEGRGRHVGRQRLGNFGVGGKEDNI